MKIFPTIFCLLFSSIGYSAITNTLPYQGRVSVSDQLPTGPRYFKFAIVDDATSPTVSYWSNDGTSIAGSEPVADYEIDVTTGLFSVKLGEGSATNVTIPSTVWSNDSLILMVWYSDTGGAGTFVLIDSLPILPVAHSHRAAIADSLASGVSVDDADADSSNELLTGAVLNGTNLELTDAGGVRSVDLSDLPISPTNLNTSALRQSGSSQTDQENVFIVGSAGVSQGSQTFTAGIDGWLRQIAIDFINTGGAFPNNTIDLEVERFLPGDGTWVVVAQASEVISFASSQVQTRNLQFSESIPQASGEVFRFHLSTTGANDLRFMISQADSYPGGDAVVGNTSVPGDFFFRTSVDAGVLYDQWLFDGDSNSLILWGGVGANPANPAFTLDINGSVEASELAGDGSGLTNIPWSSLINLPSEFADGDDVNDLDADPTNELQALSLTGSTLSINSGASAVDFSSVDLSSAVSSILDSSSGLGIGLSGSAPGAALQINSNTGYEVFQGLSNSAEIRNGSFMTGSLGSSFAVTVDGNNAYIAGSSSLLIFDIGALNGAGPSELVRINDGSTSDFDKLSFIRDIDIVGNYAYVGSFGDDAVTIIDVSDPANPSLVSKLEDNVNGFNHLAEAFKIAVSGDYAFVSSISENAVSVVNISDPFNPQLVTVIEDGVGGFDQLAGARDVSIANDLLFVTAFNDDALTIIDVSTPSAPVKLAELVDGVNGFDYLDAAFDVEVVGDYAFVTGRDDSAINIIDVSIPTSPTLVTVIRDGVGGFDELSLASEMKIVNDIIYATAQLDNALTLIDISDKQNPELITTVIDGNNGYNRLALPYAVEVSGDFIYVTSVGDDTVTIIEQTIDTITVDLIAQNRIGIGTSEPSVELHVEGDAFITGSLLDSSQAAGTNGQILTTTGSGTTWATLDVNDADADPTNELQNLTLSGNTLQINGGTNADLSSLINDADADPTNEHQDLSLSGNTLNISDGAGVTLTAANIGPGTFADGGNMSLERGQSLHLQPWDSNNGLRALNQFLSDGTTPSGLSFGNLLNIKNNTDDDPTKSNFNALNQALLTAHGGGILGTVRGGDETPALSWNTDGAVSIYNNLSLRNIESTLVLHSDNHSGRLAMYENGNRQFGSDTVTGPVLSHPIGGGLGIFPSGSAEPFLALKWGRHGDVADQDPWVSIPGELSVRGLLRMRSSDGTDVLLAKEDKTVDILNLNVTGTATLPAGSLDASAIADGSILTAKIADRSISAAKIVEGHIFTSLLAPNAVTSDKIVDGTIVRADIANNAINSDKIANDSITSDDLANNSVDTLQIQNDAVNSSKLADNSVDSAHIINGTISSSDIAPLSIGASSIGTGAISNSKLANNAVTSTKISDGTIAATDLANNAVTSAKISDGTIATADIANDAVTLDKLSINPVTSSDTSPTRVIFGGVFGGMSGTATGPGFSVTRTSGISTGGYTITWNTAFADTTYSLNITPETGANDTRLAMITNKSAGFANIRIRNPNGNAQNTSFSFIAIGN